LKVEIQKKKKKRKEKVMIDFVIFFHFLFFKKRALLNFNIKTINKNLIKNDETFNFVFQVSCAYVF